MKKPPSKSKKLAQSNVILTGKKNLSSKEAICSVSFYSIRNAHLRSWRIFSWLVASSIKWWAWGWEIGRTNEMKLFCVKKREGGKKCHWRWETLRGCGYEEKGQEKPKLKCGFGRKTDWEGKFWNGMLYTRQCKAFGLFHKFFGKISNSNCPLESKKIFLDRIKFGFLLQESFAWARTTQRLPAHIGVHLFTGCGKPFPASQSLCLEIEFLLHFFFSWILNSRYTSASVSPLSFADSQISSLLSFPHLSP